MLKIVNQLEREKILINYLRNSGFNTFFHVKIHKTDFFADNGQMDWVIGEWIFAYLGNVTEDEILHDCRTQFLRLKNIPENIDQKWFLKYNGLKILPVSRVIDGLMLKFKELEKNFKIFPDYEYEYWYLNKNENIKIIKSLDIDININFKLKFKKIKI